MSEVTLKSWCFHEASVCPQVLARTNHNFGAEISYVLSSLYSCTFSQPHSHRQQYRPLPDPVGAAVWLAESTAAMAGRNVCDLSSKVAVCSCKHSQKKRFLRSCTFSQPSPTIPPHPPNQSAPHLRARCRSNRAHIRQSAAARRIEGHLSNYQDGCGCTPIEAVSQ